MFRLIEITRIADTESQAILDFESEVEASGELHSKLGAAKKNANVRAEMLRGIDGKGNQVEYTYWVRPIEITPEG